MYLFQVFLTLGQSFLDLNWSDNTRQDKKLDKVKETD